MRALLLCVRVFIQRVYTVFDMDEQRVGFSSRRPLSFSHDASSSSSSSHFDLVTVCVSITVLVVVCIAIHWWIAARRQSEYESIGQRQREAVLGGSGPGVPLLRHAPPLPPHGIAHA